VPVWRARDIELADLAGKVGDCLKAGRRPVEPSAFLARIADVGATGVGPVVALL
jgi:hypothetical protein